MEIDYKTVENIFEQLPITYYLKRKIKVSLSQETPTSFIDFMNNEIIISYNQIVRVKNIKKEKVERYVRNNYYHEISHALLSPRPIKLIIDKDLFNIFEDERIEVLLDGYYLDVNFREAVRERPFKIQTPIDKFYYFVRYRGGSAFINEEIDKLILKYRHLTFSVEAQNLEDYQKDIYKLYQKIIKLDEETPSEIKKIEQSNNKSEEEEFKTKPQNIELQLTEQEVDDIINYVSEEISVAYSNPEFRKNVERIIYSRKHSYAKNSASIKSTSGKFRPKSIKPDKSQEDYKWFLKKGDGFLKYHKSLKLNLFIDQSGSFYRSENQVNSMLKELCFLEHKISDFSFSLVVIDTNVEIRNKHNKYIDCCGGNALTPELIKTFNKLQSRGSETVNLILFDGNASTDKIKYDGKYLFPGTKEQVENFKAFNHSNVILISDFSNKNYIDLYCKKAKKIYTENYVEELEKNIYRSFKILIK